MPADLLGPTLEQVQMWLRSAPGWVLAGFVLNVEPLASSLALGEGFQPVPIVEGGRAEVRGSPAPATRCVPAQSRRGPPRCCVPRSRRRGRRIRRRCRRRGLGSCATSHPLARTPNTAGSCTRDESSRPNPCAGLSPALPSSRERAQVPHVPRISAVLEYHRFLRSSRHELCTETYEHYS
jgi:hypothetical protein